MVGSEFETSSNINMVGLKIILTRSLWRTRKAVIMDSCFCVLERLFEMRKRGVYGSVLIKNRRY